MLPNMAINPKYWKLYNIKLAGKSMVYVLILIFHGTENGLKE